MSNYVAWYGKKRLRLSKLEQQFAALVQQETDAKRLTEAAEGLRAARLRVLRSRRAEFPPSEVNAAAVAQLDREIEECIALPVQAIIDRYRKR